MAVRGEDGVQRRDKETFMEIFGPLCTASLPLSPSVAVTTDLKFLIGADEVTLLSFCDKMLYHNSPLPTEQRQIKLGLKLWNCSFILLASRGLETSSFLSPTGA